MNKKWTRDEIILACELTRENGWKGLSATDERVQALSSLLRNNPVHAMDAGDPTFRNVNGVARKTWDIATRHPGYEGKATHGNKLDKEVLNDFLENQAEMVTMAQEIRAELSTPGGSAASLL